MTKNYKNYKKLQNDKKDKNGINNINDKMTKMTKKKTNYQDLHRPLLREEGDGAPAVPESSSTANKITVM